MRKITQLSVNAFLNDAPIRQANMSVKIEDNETNLYLHGNKIAIKFNTGTIYISHAGYPTRTTFERLNGIPNVRVNVKRGVVYLNGNEWDGKWIQIN